MSFTDDFLKELEKKKKKIDNSIVVSPYASKAGKENDKAKQNARSSTGDSFTDEFLNELGSLAKKNGTTYEISTYDEDDDIGPTFDYDEGRSGGDPSKMSEKEKRINELKIEIREIEDLLGYNDSFGERLLNFGGEDGWLTQLIQGIATGQNTDQQLKDLLKEYKAELASLENPEEAQDEKKDKWYEGWLKGGAFSDGYQVGDLAGTAIATVGDTALGVAQGFGNMYEGITDFILQGGSEAADWVGLDSVSDYLEKGANKQTINTLVNSIKGDYIRDNTIWGEKGQSIPQGVGNILGMIYGGKALGGAGLGTKGVSIGTSVGMGASSAGSGISDAKSEGIATHEYATQMVQELDIAFDDGRLTKEQYDAAIKKLDEQLNGRLDEALDGSTVTDIEAWSYGTMKGVVDAVTELFFGGLGKGVEAVGISRGIGGLDDIFAKKASEKLAKHITNKYAKRIVVNGTEYVIKAGGEGLEEVLATYGDAFAKWLSYMSDEELSEFIDHEEALEAFISSFVSSGITQGGGLVSSIKGDTDYVTGYTDNEQAVIDKEIENRITEQEKNGKKLSNSEKKKITEAVKEDLDKGYISIDTIEEVLGGDSYKSYQDTVKNEDALKSEFEELEKVKTNDATLGQSSRYNELKNKLAELETTSQRSILEKKYKDDAYEVAKGSRLESSYFERARGGEAFTADLSKYDEKQRATIQSAIDAGFLNNRGRTHDFVNLIAKISADKGVTFDFLNNEKLKTSGFAVDGAIVNGYYDKKSGTVGINLNSDKALNTVVGHEITHVLEGTEIYNELQTALINYAKAKGDYQGRVDALSKLYDAKDIDSELTADLVGDYLFTDADFVNRLSTEHRNVFQKVFDEIKYLYKTATAGSKEARELEKVKRVFEEAYRTNVKGQADAQGETKYSITEPFTDSNGNTYQNAVLLDTNLFDGTHPRDWGATLKNEINKRSSANPLILPITDENGETVILQFASPSDRVTKDGKSNHAVNDELSYTSDNISKLAVVHIDEVISVSEENNPYYTNENNHQWLDKNGWLHRNANVINSKNGNIYNITVDVAKAADGRTILYATNGKIKKVGNVQVNSLKIKGSGQNSNSGNIVSQKGNIVNSQSALSTDSEGRQLTKEQSEYFKDSKVKDENGNLMVMYHGTPNGDFTVFNDGTYFTASKEYADKYQNPGASSLNSRKVASSPKTFETYLNITKPFDISDLEARKIYINDYIKGGNAVGINPYLSDAEYNKIDSIDWTEGEDLREFLIDNGYDYDGLVLDEGAVGGYGEDVEYRGTSYVVFSPEQVKNVDNAKPTSNPDIRFSLSKAVEETPDLIAAHNLTSDKLLKSLELGGLPMPSIAITKADSVHNEYGDISLILRKDAIDPKANKENKIYSGDAWTPVYPTIEFKPNVEVVNKISEKYYELAHKYGYDDLRPMYRFVNDTEDALKRDNGEQGMLKELYENTGMMQVYLLDSGKGKVDTIQKEVRSELSDAEVEMNEYFIKELGADIVDDVMSKGDISPMKHRVKYWETYGDKIKEVYKKFLSEEYGFSQEEIDNVLSGMKTFDYLRFVRDAHLYRINGRVTTRIEADNSATQEAIRQKAAEGYKEWIDGLFNGIEEKTGIRNNRDYFTPSGNRRSWDALHWENTLENVVRVMKEQGNGEHTFFTGHGIWGAAANEYKSIEEVKADSDRLKSLPKEEYEEIRGNIGIRLQNVAQRIMSKSETNQFIAADNALACIVDAVRHSRTEAGIFKELKQYSQLNVTEADASEIVSIVADIAKMPTEYFESKPRRAVGFDEVGVFVIPNNADAKLKQELLNRGYSIAEYDPNVEGDRQKVVNSFEEYKFSLSDVGEAPQEYGSYNVYGRDMSLGEDIAPVGPTEDTASQAAPETVGSRAEILPDDYAPMSEDEAAMVENEALGSLTDEDAPPVVDMPYYEQRDTATIDDKSLKGISERASEYLGLGRTERAVLEGIIQKYSQDENVTRDQLYSEIRDKFSVLEDSTPNEDVIQIKKDLRSMRIYVSDEVKADFGDGREDGYSKFLRSNFGRLWLVKDIETGVPVDSAYEELSDLYPSYFPEDIINPADQLRKISEMASAESNDVLPVELSDEEIQRVADMVYSDITGYMNDSRLEAATEASHIPLDDDLAPLPEEDALLGQERSMLLEDYESKKADIQKLIDDKNGFISKRANELYWELSGLKKGVRASRELGYLLDQGYSWGELKTALVNTKLHPDSRVREDSAIESIVREALNEEYENLAYEIDEIDSEYNEKVQKLEADAKAKNKVLSVREVYEQKLANHRNSLAALEAGKEKSLANFNEAIGKKLNEYNSLKNKNTKRANTLLQQMENLRLRRDNVQADYAIRIAKQQARLEAFESKSYEEFEQKELAVRRRDNHKRIVDGIKARFTEQGYDLDEVFDKAKNLSTFATVDNTPQRVMEKSLGYKEGQILSDLTVDQVARNESEGIKWLNSVTNKKDGLLAQLVKKYGIKPGSKASAAAQMYAEGFFVDTNGDVIKYGDAELAKDFPNEQVRQNIIGLARDQRVRQFYDETLDKINESRVRNAYPEIQKLDNYFLHFRAMEDTFSRLGLPFNPNDIKAKDLPTDLNGVTADLKPGQPYFASARHREGIRTSHDLLGGLERYASSAKNQIYHIDDIQTLRAIRNYIADGYGQAKGLESLDSLSEEEAQEKIKQVYGSHLSTFAKFLNEEANVIAGKTALIDRGLEGIIGRRGITLIDTINKQVGANMVGFNVSSSLTNFIPVAQTFAKSNKFDFTKAFAQTASNKINSIFGRSDEFIDNNPTVLRRRGADRFYQTPYQKVGDIGYTLMGVVDDISTELIVRTKYNEYIRKGMSEQDAVNAADKWTSRLMADRSLGQMPQIYNSRMLGLFTKFQLEVRNQLDAQFYDTIQEKKVSNEDIENGLLRNAKTAAQVTSTFAQLAIAQHLYGMAFEAIAGYNPAFDIVSVLATALGFDDDEDDEDTVLDNLGQGFLELLEDLPYTSALTGGGRIPISSALPVEDVLTAISGQDANGNEISRKDAWKTVGEAAPYYFMPGGYGQLKKTIKGMEMFDEDLPIAGSYTDSGKLRYPVDDTVKNRLQAAIFGQYANENAGKYFDGGHKALDEKQIQEFIDVDIPIEDYWDYREGLYALNKESETGTASLAEKIDYIMSLDLPIEKKNLLANNLTERKEPIDLTGYEEYGNYKDFDFAKKYPEKYAFLQDHNISVSEYEEFDEDTKEAYTWASKNPAKYKVSKAISDDLMTYRSYTDALYDIKADKDEDGKSISGSRKEKVINYINNLDADYGQKIILFKSEYPTDDTYNYEIIDYLNGRDDISYSDMVTILTELGFKVEGDNVYWD